MPINPEYIDVFKDRSLKIEELKELINSELNLVLFAGAGISKSVGYKSWDELIDLLEKELKNIDKSINVDREKLDKDNLKIAQFIKDKILEETGSLKRYYNIIVKEYDSYYNKKEPNNLVKQLMKIPVKACITTNYDLILEETIQLLENEFDDNLFFIDSQAKSSNINATKFIDKYRKSDRMKSVLHIHGIARQPETIVLSSAEYDRAYDLDNNQWSLLRRMLWSLLTFHHTIFVGFSFKDPFLNKMLESICSDIWGWNESSHYAIISYDSNEDSELVVIDKIKKFQSNYGINVITYDSANGHNKLDEIINSVLTFDVTGPVVNNNIGTEGAYGN